MTPRAIPCTYGYQYNFLAHNTDLLLLNTAKKRGEGRGGIYSSMSVFFQGAGLVLTCAVYLTYIPAL